MLVMYFTEQPMSAYTADIGLEVGHTALMFSNKYFDPVAGSRLYNEYLEHYIYAEEQGVEGFMLNEHHNAPFCMQAKCNIFASILAAVTKRVKIVLLTSLISTQQVIEALQIGARGIVLKDSVASYLGESLRAVLSGDYFSVAEDAIKDLESVLTLVGGKVVYATDEFRQLAQPPVPVMPEWSPVAKYGGYRSSRGRPVLQSRAAPVEQRGAP